MFLIHHKYGRFYSILFIPQFHFHFLFRFHRIWKFLLRVNISMRNHMHMVWKIWFRCFWILQFTFLFYKRNWWRWLNSRSSWWLITRINRDEIEMFYLNTIEQLFLFVEQLDQLEVCQLFSRLLTGIPILAVFQNLRWNSNKTSL